MSMIVFASRDSHLAPVVTSGECCCNFTQFHSAAAAVCPPVQEPVGYPLLLKPSSQLRVRTEELTSRKFAAYNNIIDCRIGEPLPFCR